jgi:hypothetical protein
VVAALLAAQEPAATLARFAFSPLTATLPEFSTAIAHLRDVLGDQTHEYGYGAVSAYGLRAWRAKRIPQRPAQPSSVRSSPTDQLS